MQCPRCGYKPSGKNRSIPQNKYYWGCVVPILAEETGTDKLKMHEMLKRKFLTERNIVKGKKGQIVEMEFEGSTADLDTKQWEELMSQIRIWASSELSIFIPEPHENLEDYETA